MFRCIIVCLIVTVAGMGAADAQSRRQIDATPFAHAPCSVLDGQPCTPSFCSVFNDGPCIPEIDYPAPEPATHDRKRTSAGPGREIPQAGPRSRHHRRPVCGAAVLLVAAADIARRGHADVGSLQLQALRRDHRHPARDLCHGRRPGRYPRCLSQRSTPRSRPARRSNSRPGWAARWPGGRSRSATSTTAILQSRRRSRDGVRVAHCAPSP